MGNDHSIEDGKLNRRRDLGLSHCLSTYCSCFVIVVGPLSLTRPGERMRMVRRFQTLQVGSSDKKGENQVHKSHVSDCLRSKRRYEESEKKWVNIVLIRQKKKTNFKS